MHIVKVIGKLALKVHECRVQCVRVMEEFRNDQKEDFFGSYFHYLQRGYHKCELGLDAKTVMKRLKLKQLKTRTHLERYFQGVRTFFLGEWEELLLCGRGTNIMTSEIEKKKLW